MKDHRIILIGKEEICENTLSFTFDKKGSGFDFEAGQYAHFTIENPETEDLKGNSRPLSIASSPHINDSIVVAARIGSSAFVKNLSALPVGRPVYVSKPLGNFNTDLRSKTPSVFIAGGIGITPVRSILEKAANENSDHEIFLFYSNKKESQAAFMEDLLKWQKELKRFMLIPVVENTDSANSFYESGTINEDILKKYLLNLNDKNFFLVGPLPMVESVRNILNGNRVKENKIKTEKFEET